MHSYCILSYHTPYATNVRFYLLLTERSEQESLLVEMNTWFQDITLNTMFRMVVGKRFSTDLEGSRNQDYRKVFRDFVKFFGDFVPSDSFPFLSWLDLGGYEKAMKKTSEALDEVFDNWIREKKNNSGGHQLDFMDLMLSAVEKDEELSDYDGDSVVKANCLVCIIKQHHPFPVISSNIYQTLHFIYQLIKPFHNQENINS